TTNGYKLESRVFHRLVELGVRRYQVSLDGSAAEHDRTRRQANGRRTLARIWQNLLNIRRTRGPVAVRLRLHVHPDNRDSLLDLLDELATAFGGDSRFHVFLKGVVPLGGIHDDTFPYLGAHELATTMRVLADKARRLGLDCRMPGAPDSMCYAARANSYVIR